MIGKLAKLTWVFLPILFAHGCSVTSSPSEVADAGQGRVIGAQEALPCVTPADEERLAGALFELINAERTKAGLEPLRRATALDRLATDYACRMIREEFFAHQDPATGDGPGQRALNDGYRFYAVGENLAAGYESSAEAMTGWMASEEHRAIILAPQWTEVGLGVRVGGTYKIYWVQEFGDPV